MRHLVFLLLASCGGPAFAPGDFVPGTESDAGAAADAVLEHGFSDAQRETPSPAADVVDDAGAAADAAAVGLMDAADDVAGDVSTSGHAVTCSGDPPAGCACSAMMSPPACAAPFAVWCAAMGASLQGECCNADCL
jgi:hypothetical protein